jgi:hypothetical protein
MIIKIVASVFVVSYTLVAWYFARRAFRAEALAQKIDASASKVGNGALKFAALEGLSFTPVRDPGKQALEILRSGENCDWYSIKHTDEQHEAFDSLEIYWRTNVEQPERNEFGYGRGPFELKAGFRVRWRVAGTHHSYVEAVGMDLMSTILEAREKADQLIARAQTVKEMGRKHPALEAWKAQGEKRDYSFYGLDIEKWNVRLDYPGGLSWAEHADLDQAVTEALTKAPH